MFVTPMDTNQNQKACNFSLWRFFFPGFEIIFHPRLFFQLGCTRNHAQNMFHCSTVSYDGRHIHKKNNRSAQYDMQCCSKGNLLKGIDNKTVRT